MSKITLTLPEDFKGQLEAMAQVFNMHLVYCSPDNYEFVPRTSACNVTSIRKARTEAIKKRMEEREANKPEPKPMTLHNVSPMPVKHKQSFMQRWFSNNPTFDGPGAA